MGHAVTWVAVASEHLIHRRGDIRTALARLLVSNVTVLLCAVTELQWWMRRVCVSLPNRPFSVYCNRDTNTYPCV